MPIIIANNPGIYILSDSISCDCLTDLNVDGVTNILDFFEILAGWGACGEPYYGGDVDRNGVADIADFLALLANWGACL